MFNYSKVTELIRTIVCFIIMMIMFIMRDHLYEYMYTMVNHSALLQPVSMFNVADPKTISDISNDKYNFSYWKGMKEMESCTIDNEYCTTLVSSVSGQYLSIWKKSSFIMQKNTKYSYYDLLQKAKPSGQSCDEGYKKCGILDSLNQTLCMPEQEACPINQIEFSTVSTPSDIFIKKENVNTSPLFDGSYLHISNAEIDMPIVTELVFGPKSFCLDPDLRGLGEPYYEYELSSSKGVCNKDLGYETDFCYKSIDKYNKYRVYEDNEIIPKLTPFLNYEYPLNSLERNDIYLYKHNYIGFHLECLGDTVLNKETFEDEQKHFSKNNKTIIAFIIFSIIHFVYFFVWMVLEKKMPKLCFILDLVILLIRFCLFTVEFGLSMNIANYIYNCADERIVTAMNTLLKINKKRTQSLFYVFLVELLLFGYYIFHVIKTRFQPSQLNDENLMLK